MPEVKVGGMHCQNCQNAVYKALAGIDGIGDVKVDLGLGLASWQNKNPASPVDAEKIKEAIRKTGFDA